ncbi:MAG: right-handed parallel beta-helix repeat-containing protein [Paracoccaceae bacterium]
MSILAPGDDLAAAIAAAAPGDTLELQGGDYGTLTVKRAGGQPGQPVTLRSADPADPARLSGMDLREMTHLVLEGLLFDYVYSPKDKPYIRPFQVSTTRGLTIRNSVFDGDLADSDGLAAYPTGYGLWIRSSAEIRFEKNEIRDFYRGVIFSDSVDLSVVGNDLHSIRMDGMNFAQVERALIENNVIRDFKRAVGSADHADMIQFWTNKTERPSRDITIRNNVLNSGLGWYTQSIFMRNEEVDTGRAGAEMFYRNIVIEGNVIINAHLHGISVGETDGLIIRNNTVLHNVRSDGTKTNAGLWTPQVRVSKTARNVRIEANVLHRITGYKAQSDWLVTNNLEVQDRSPDQANHYNDVFVAALNGDPRDLASFRPLRAGPLAGTGLGAPILDGTGLQKAPQGQATRRAPVIRAIPAPDVPSRFSFDIRESSDSSGFDLSGSKIQWNFGDGATAEGVTVSHNFSRPGVFEVTVTIILPDGKALENSARVRPGRPEVIVFDPQVGTITSYVADPPVTLDLPLSPGPIQLGGDHPLITMPRGAIAPFFGARSFVLQTRVRSSGGYKSAGVLMHIYKTLIVTVGGRGTVDVQFDTETASTLKISTRPLPVLAGEWVDLTLDYSQDEGIMRVLVNGELAAQGQTSGQIRPLEHWGLALGHPFQTQSSFQGEMDSLVLKVGRHDDAAAD